MYFLEHQDIPTKASKQVSPPRSTPSAARATSPQAPTPIGCSPC